MVPPSSRLLLFDEPTVCLPARLCAVPHGQVPHGHATYRSGPIQQSSTMRSIMHHGTPAALKSTAKSAGFPRGNAPVRALSSKRMPAAREAHAPEAAAMGHVSHGLVQLRRAHPLHPLCLTAASACARACGAARALRRLATSLHDGGDARMQ